MGVIGRWGLVLAVVAGCVGPESVTCKDGFLCPSTLTCAPNGGCASTIQIANCENRVDGDSCNTGAGQGSCVNGICLGSQCGNGIVDDGELCDVGLATSGEKCRSDCRKIEVCGDGFLDEAEQCDDSNQNDADGCTSECRSSEWVAKALYGAGNLAAEERLGSPSSVFTDREGNLFVADSANHRVLRIDASTQVATVVAGTGTAGFSGDGGAGTSAQLFAPLDVYVDGLGDAYIADSGNGRIRRVESTTGIISTVAGGGTLDADESEGSSATSAELFAPSRVIVMGNGDFYILGDDRVRVVSVDSGLLSTVAGGGNFDPDENTDGLATDLRLLSPLGLAVVPSNSGAVLFLSDGGNANGRVFRVDPNGFVAKLAGGGNLEPAEADGGPAVDARLNRPEGLAVVPTDSGTEIYIADYLGNRVRRVDSAGIITTFAGTGEQGFSGDDGLATSATFNRPQAVSAFPGDSGTGFYIADSGNRRIRRVDSNGVITTFAGMSEVDPSDEALSATSVSLDRVQGIAAVRTGLGTQLYVADTFNDIIRRVDSNGLVTTVAGGGMLEPDEAEGVLATSVRLSRPYGLFAVSGESGIELYIADSGNNRIRRVDSDGIITTVAGGGNLVPAEAEGKSAVDARLDSPRGLAVVGTGPTFELYIADTFNNRIRRVDSAGVISTVAGTGQIGFGGDDGVATSALLIDPRDVAAVRTGSGVELFIADSGNNRIRRVDSAGIITTVAGGGGLAPDQAEGVSAKSARLDNPSGISVVSDLESTQLYIADSGTNRIRQVDSGGLITTVAGSGSTGFLSENFGGDGGLATSALLLSPNRVAVVPSDLGAEMYVADSRNDRVRRVNLDGVITTVVGQLFPFSTGLYETTGVGVGSDPQSISRWPKGWLIGGGGSGTVQEIDILEQRFRVLAGKYLHREATGNLARFRGENFGSVNGIAYDEEEKLIYLTETEANRVHVVTTDDRANGVVPDAPDTWTIAVLAGDGTSEAGQGFQDGALASSLFRAPEGLWLSDANGSKILYVADTGNHVIRAIDIDAMSVSTIAGTPETRGFFGDGELAANALLYEPVTVTECPNGDLFIAEIGSHHVRRVEVGTKILSTVLGVGVPGSSGAGSPATIFPVDSPRGLTCDAFGNLYVTSRTALRLLAAADPAEGSESGVVDGAGSVQTIYEDSQHNCLAGVAVQDPRDPESSLFLTDSCSGSGIELERIVR